MSNPAKTIKTKDLKTSLRKKGFRLENTHHKNYYFYVGEKKTTVKTRISHGSKEYGSGLLSAVASQMKISRKQLEEFVECSLSEDDYRDHLVDSGKIKLS